MDVAKMMTSWQAVVTPLILLVLYQVRNSLPFSWHIRVFLPYIIARRKAVSGNKNDKTKVSQGLPQLRHDCLSIGRDPFSDVLTQSFTATVDECDFMGHLSNSSYPKNLDVIRTNYASSRYLQFTLDGGWIPLGGTYFEFRNEIKLFKTFQIRSRILTWGDKWIYLKNEFVTVSKEGKEIIHCICISKHCCKVGRKTIPPWFVLAYSGFTSSKTFNLSDNFNKAQELRLRLQKVKRSDNPVKAFVPSAKKENLTPDQHWMFEDYWNTSGWEEGRQRGMKELQEFIVSK